MAKKDLTVVPSGEAQVIENFRVSESNVQITFKQDALAAAIAARSIRGIETPDDFFGPDFKDIKGYQVAGPMFVVQTKKDEQYIYPLDSIARIKTYITYQE